MRKDIDIDELSEEEILELCVENILKLIDSDGFVYWVDTYDEDGMYIHSDEGSTHRISRTKYQEFKPVCA